MTGTLAGVALLLVHAVLLTASALVLAGAGPRLRAVLDGEAAPPLAQPWRDLLRLARKRPVAVEGLSWLHGALPGLALASTAAAALLVPSFALGMATAPLSDLVVVAGLLALGRCAVALAGWEAGPDGGAVAADRGMALCALAEPALLLAVLAIALLSGTANLDGAAATLREGGPRLPLLLAAPALALAALADLGRLGGQGGLGRNGGHAALATVYSGHGLALLGLVAGLRRVLWVALAASVLLPFGLAPAGAGPAAWMLGLAAWAGKLAGLGAGLAVAEAAAASLAPARVPGLLGAAALLALLGALLLFAGQRGA